MWATAYRRTSYPSTFSVEEDTCEIDHGPMRISRDVNDVKPPTKIGCRDRAIRITRVVCDSLL